MANSRQARKRVKQAIRRTKVNRNRVSRIRTYLRRVDHAIESGNDEAAATALREAQPEVMRGVSRGVLHKNTASRKISRLSKQIKALSS